MLRPWGVQAYIQYHGQHYGVPTLPVLASTTVALARSTIDRFSVQLYSCTGTSRTVPVLAVLLAASIQLYVVELSIRS